MGKLNEIFVAIKEIDYIEAQIGELCKWQDTDKPVIELLVERIRDLLASLVEELPIVIWPLVGF